MDEGLSLLNRDVMAHILARVDGPTLASTSCADRNFNEIAKEELCHSTWPSTMDENVKNTINSLQGGFCKFFANSFPLILYKVPVGAEEEIFETKGNSYSSSPPTFELVSLVDVYYEKKCIFSKALYKSFGGKGNDEMHSRWYMDGPFRLDALHEHHVSDEIEIQEDEIGDFPTSPTAKKDKKRGMLCRKLEEKVRLSWILLNTSTGQSVNLSSWKPLSIHQHWPSEGDVLMHFGSLLTGDKGQPIECVITAKCWLLDKDGS